MIVTFPLTPCPVKRARGDLGDHRISLSLRLRGGKGRVRGEKVANSNNRAENRLKTVSSKDGTRIAFDQSGAGPALILVLGAFNDRATAVPLSRFLQAHFSVFNYDRRGRGESSDTPPYTVEREIEDLDALIAEAGRGPCALGYSARAVLVLRATAHG